MSTTSQPAAVSRQIYRGKAAARMHVMAKPSLLLDDQWCDFLRANSLLVCLSIDGPREVHDHYRVDRGGRGRLIACSVLLVC